MTTKFAKDLNHWDKLGLDLASRIAKESKDPSTQCGAAILRDDNSVASLGFNGFPKGVRDLPERYEHREVKYQMVVHAEVNAILLSREPLRGTTLYCTLHPCAECAAKIVQVGISRVVAIAPTEAQRARWGVSMDLAKLMFVEAGVTLDIVH